MAGLVAVEFMIISDTRRFAFIHIPKCAGSSVRRALQHFDETGGIFRGRVETHPVLGRIDWTHLPLATLKAHFPEIFRKLQAYETVAVLRDPFARFPSALAQRLTMYRGVPRDAFDTLDDERLRAEIDLVLAFLRERQDFIDPEFIHLARQEAFLTQDGERVVKHLVAIDRLDALAPLVRRLTGESEFEMERVNATRTHRAPWIRPVLREVRRRVLKRLPRAVEDYAEKQYFRIVFSSDTAFSQRVYGFPEVKEFVSEYYSRDLDLYRWVVAMPEGYACPESC